MPLLLASADDFHTQQWLRLPAAVQEWEGEGAVRCGAGLSAVHTRSRLLLGTASGLFRLGHGFQERHQASWVHAQPEMQQAEHLELLLMGCIERIIVCAQPSPVHPEISDIVLAIEGRRGGPAIHLLSSLDKDANADVEGRFRELVDKDGLSISAWAQHISMLASASFSATPDTTTQGPATPGDYFQSDTAKDDSPLTIVDAAFGLLRPSDFMFLIRLHANGMYCLIVFDHLSQIWSLRYVFPTPDSTSSSSSSSSSAAHQPPPPLRGLD